MSQFFGQPFVFLSWELVNGTDPAKLVDQVAAAGFKGVIQEYGDPHTQPTTDEVKALRAECKRKLDYFGMWQVAPRDLTLLAEVAPNFWVLNVESDPYDYTGLLAQFRSKHPHLPAGVISNFDPDINFAPFTRANVKAIPEAYAYAPGQDANTTPTNMVRLAKSRGYTYVFPCFGVFDGGRLLSYAGERHAGDGWSVFLDASMGDEDWATAASWNSALR